MRGIFVFFELSLMFGFLQVPKLNDLNTYVFFFVIDNFSFLKHFIYKIMPNFNIYVVVCKKGPPIWLSTRMSNVVGASYSGCKYSLDC